VASFHVGLRLLQLFAIVVVLPIAVCVAGLTLAQDLGLLQWGSGAIFILVAYTTTALFAVCAVYVLVARYRK
jgi:hypothetical protein